MSPRKIQFCIFLFILFNLKVSPLVLASSSNVSFEFPSFNLRNLTLLGDSYLRNGVIGLTRDVTVPSSSSGTVIYNNPVPFFDQESTTTASFSTRFSFSILGVNENSYGDGLSFFLSQDNQTLGSPGEYLGLVNSSQLTKNKFVAIEFDTRLDAHFNDPNDHHVGLDIDSLNSIKTADPILQDIDLKSGDLITAWVDYKNDLRVLEVYMSYSSLKPGNPILTVDIDLSEYLKRDMYVGFSGSTEGSTELHLVANWSFRTSGFLPGEVLLVYEFMPYGSLDRMLYEEGSELGIFLNWAHRQKIAVGLASSLTYLHHECEQQVIHRDIKTSNIMLDGNLNARLGDFGLARLMEHDKSPASTLTAGTMGYLAPEYLHYGKATEKTDVFSYGVVILELVCGKRPIEREPVSQKMVNLVDWVWGLYGEGNIIEAADPRLSGEFEEEMRKLLLVGLSCANPDSSGRPAMRRVLQILNGEAEPMAVPGKKPSLTFSCGLALTIEDIFSNCD
ncbi:L-type lectin-domain containing receptor kinase S.7 [Populus alba x Populus x berolinensis]|nr:L-type lectin-domain containing receptor kinase S.7 [Populus alba x Populus x berolinensis]